MHGDGPWACSKRVLCCSAVAMLTTIGCVTLSTMCTTHGCTRQHGELLDSGKGKGTARSLGEPRPRSAQKPGPTRSTPIKPNWQGCTFVQPPATPLVDVRSCLRGKRVFVGGNSVARHFAFHLAASLEVSLLDVNFAKSQSEVEKMRGKEKALCGQGTFGQPDDAEACSMEVAGLNTSITFGWEPRVFSSTLFKELARRPPDVVILSAGSDDIFDPSRRATWQEVQAREAPLLAQALLAMPTSRIYWRTSPRVCDKNGSSFGHPSSVLNAALQASNSLILSRLCEPNETASPALMRVADSFAWTWDRCAEYDDHVHHSALASQQLGFILGDLCNDEHSAARVDAHRTRRLMTSVG